MLYRRRFTLGTAAAPAHVCATDDNWDGTPIYGNTADLILTDFKVTGSTYGEIIAQSIAFNETIDATYGFKIWRSDNHTQSNIFIHTGVSSITVIASALKCCERRNS